MEFKIKQNSFLQLLKRQHRVYNNKPVIPVLTGVKIETKENSLIFTTSDTNTTLITSFDNDEELTVTKPGSIVIDLNDLLRLITAMSKADSADSYCTLKTDNSNFLTTIKGENSQFRLFGLDPKLFPRFYTAGAKKMFALSSSAFTKLIDKTLIATSEDSSNPMYHGVHFIIKNQALEAQATDSRRLSKIVLADPNFVSDKEYAFDLVNTDLKRVKALLGDSDALTFYDDTDDNGNYLITFGNSKLVVSHLMGTFPNVDRVIPKDDALTLRLTFNTADFVKQLNQALVMTLKMDHPTITLNKKKDEKELLIKSVSAKVGSSKLSILPTNDAAPDAEFSVACNPNYLLQALSAIDSEEFDLWLMPNPLRPFEIKPYQSTDNFIQVLVPIRTY